MSLWGDQRQKYWTYWQHFDGSWLDDPVSSSDSTAKYPLKLNPFNMVCMLHAGFLFGEVQDGNDPLVTAVVEPWGRGSSDEQRDTASRLTDIVNRVWTENSGRALQQEGGLITQILGGCVYGAAYDDTLEAEGRLPIRIDHVMPEYFFPVSAPTQYWQLLEAIVCFEITKLQARLMYDTTVSSDHALYQEHWKKDSYEISVDGAVAKWGGHALSGAPVGGIVPYTYIPHIRVGEFYGISLLAGKDEIAQEINERYADVGDIVSENARMLPAVKNSGKITVRTLSHGVTILDLGRSAPGMDPPEITYPTGIQPNVATISWATELMNLARTEAYCPPVCFGIDEGSQRSGLTLALRMIPLLVHIRQERTLWTPGLNQIARHILAICADKEIEGVTKADLKNVRIWQEWAPIMPRGRDGMINELILRLNAGLIDPEAALDRLGDIRDTKTAMNLIKEWMEFQAELGPQPGEGNPFGGTGSRGEQAGMSRPSAPTASSTQEE